MRDASFLALNSHGFHRIAYSEWGDAANPRVVVCVHGLTRNRHDFDHLARSLADSFRVVCMDVVGRGDSEWLEHTEDYTFTQYQQDAAALIARATAPAAAGWLQGLFSGARLERSQQVDWIGTSMGGLIGMLLAAHAKSPIRRLVLNDVGPLVPWSGLVRLKGELGRDVRPYDPAILRTYRTGAGMGMPLGERFLEGVDLWPAWDAIKCPVLALRGADSDVFTERTAQEMQKRGPSTRLVEFAGVGHAPGLMDGAQIAPIREFLSAR